MDLCLVSLRRHHDARSLSSVANVTGRAAMVRGDSAVCFSLTSLPLIRKVPWRLSGPRKQRVRERLRNVDDVIATIEKSGVACKSLDRALALPKESEMPARDKYTVFNRNSRGFRKGIHKVCDSLGWPCALLIDFCRCPSSHGSRRGLILVVSKVQGAFAVVKNGVFVNRVYSGLLSLCMAAFWRLSHLLVALGLFYLHRHCVPLSFCTAFRPAHIGKPLCRVNSQPASSLHFTLAILLVALQENSLQGLVYPHIHYTFFGPFTPPLWAVHITPSVGR